MQTLSFIEEKKFNGFDDIKELVKEFYKKKITVSYDQITAETIKRRIIFTCSKKVRNYTFDNIALECNGLILETSRGPVPEWKLVMMPLLSPKTDVNTRKINDWLSENLFEVYAMEDGTTINLYYYNEKWVISTARGIEMNNIKFNTLTYQSLLEECILQYVNEVSEFYSALNKNFCYTFGFKHPDMHPFKEDGNDVYKFWSIQQVDISSIISPENKLSPQREKILSLPIQKKFSFKTKNMHSLYKRLKSAYDDYIDGKHLNYGYILVSKNPSITLEYSVIMLESTLMKSIRNLWYNGSYVECCKIRNYDRINIILLNSYLDDSRHDVFLELFPQYAEEFNKLEQYEDSMVNTIFKLIKDPNDEKKNAHADILLPLVNEVKNTLTIDMHDKPIQKIRDIIHSNIYINIYYMICYPSTNN